MWHGRCSSLASATTGDRAPLRSLRRSALRARRDRPVRRDLPAVRRHLRGAAAARGRARSQLRPARAAPGQRPTSTATRPPRRLLAEWRRPGGPSAVDDGPVVLRVPDGVQGRRGPAPADDRACSAPSGSSRRARAILPHERTTPKDKQDRLDLLRATRTNLSPIWGLSLARACRRCASRRASPTPAPPTPTGCTTGCGGSPSPG